MTHYQMKIKNKGLKKSWIATQLGISPASLTLYLKGERNMPLHIESKLKMILR